MKIVHVTPFFGEQFGGSERYVNNLVNNQWKNHEIHIFTTTKFHHKRGIRKTDKYTIHKFYAPITIWNINPISYILSKLRNFDADIVHVHSYLYFISNQAIISKYFSKIPTLLHLHGGLGLPPYKTSFLQKISKLFYDNVIGKLMIKGADLVASVSKFDIERAQKLFGEKSSKFVYLPNGVDVNQFTSKRDKSLDANNILYVGDIEPWKGIDFLLEVINGGNRFKRETKFHFIGQGSLVSMLNKFSNRINYLGEQPHSSIPSYMRKADIFVFPSKWEGTPTVVLEAMSSGLPVVSTPVGDIPLIIQNKKNGIICKRNKDEFAKSISELQQDSKLRETIAKNARKYIEENYNFKKIADLVEKSYYKILS